MGRKGAAWSSVLSELTLIYGHNCHERSRHNPGASVHVTKHKESMTFMKRKHTPFYIMASATHTDTYTITKNLLHSLKDAGYTVGIFRPLNPLASTSTDVFLHMLVDESNTSLSYDDCTGVDYLTAVTDRNAALSTIIARFAAVQDTCDIVLILGSDYSANMAGECDLNATIAMNLGAHLLLVESFNGQDAATFQSVCRATVQYLRDNHHAPAALIIDAASADDTASANAASTNAALADALELPVFTAADFSTDALLELPAPTAVTPHMFQYQLLERAKANKKHIVLPEGDDDRILKAAHIILREGFADLTILGDPDTIRTRAQQLGLDLSAATLLDPTHYEGLDEFVETYYELRKHKGISMDDARQKLQDISYFATMMVHLGKADGMVSGAAHTTAHTIRPSFEIIKTKPGVSTVSSIFLMCLQDHVLAFGDCAVNIDPNPTQLADIAVSSAETASQFGAEPRVALLSYSTGTSGSGAAVDKVRDAVTLAKENGMAYPIDGPIQFDAAVDATVAAAKAPDSPVAGRATVLVFPDLNTGNNTYKAVQRTAGAVAVGPILQGLKKPINDLSRGALVDDIVNTVAVTAVQAQNI